MKTTNQVSRIYWLARGKTCLSFVAACLLAILFNGAQLPPVKSKSLSAPKLEIGVGGMYVYQDYGSTENHFLAKALISLAGMESNVKRLNENCRTNPFSGSSCIECSIDLVGDAWGGWLYMYGYQPQGATERQLNFAKYPDSGFDLSKAKRLTFMARGKQGGEQVEFFVAGLGWNPESNNKADGADYPDSSPKISTNYIKLDKEWKEYSILLEGADLSYISCGFGFVTSGNYNEGNVTFYIDDVKYCSDKGAEDVIQSAETAKNTPAGVESDKKPSFLDPGVLAAIVSGIFALLGTLLYFRLWHKPPPPRKTKNKK